MANVVQNGYHLGVCCGVDGKYHGGDGDNDGWRQYPKWHWICGICTAHVLRPNVGAIAAEPVTKEDEEVDDIMNWLGPLILSLGFSGIFGFSCSAAFKLYGEGLAGAIGILFAAVQLLVYFDVIDINWKKVEQKLDITGDGKFDDEDIKVGMRTFLKILAQGIPGIGGFASGFSLGLKYI